MPVSPQVPRNTLRERVYWAWQWRKKLLAEWALHRLARLDARTRLRICWPWPLRKPWERSKIRFGSIGGGIGDELMCTAIFREIKRRNPRCHITFFSWYPELWRSNPHVDVVERRLSKFLPNAWDITYGPILPPRRPLIAMMGECIGLDHVPAVVEPPRVEPPRELAEAIGRIPAPRFVIQPLASPGIPNKNWPLEYWRELIPLLLEHGEVIEVGTAARFPGEDFGRGFHSWAGKTDVVSFAWLVGQATVFVGPVSSGMHLAVASGVPTVIIFGGYESPTGYSYENVTALYTPVPCAPCWLASNCPFDLKCQHAIKPGQVAAAVLERAGLTVQSSGSVRSSP